MKKIAIIGSGICALTLAHKLKDTANIELFEKSRGVSGRMSTRNADQFQYDHGAQFFLIKTKEFKNFLSPMIKKGLVARWDARYSELDREFVTHSHQWNQDNPHYIGNPKMNSIAKHLAKDLNVHLNKSVNRIEMQNGWSVFDDKGENLGSFDWVISTAPPLQTSKILPRTFKYYDEIYQKKMKSCYSLMLGFEKPIELKWDAALVKNSKVSWISVNSSKPNRPNHFSLLVHSTNEWAEKHIDGERDVLKRQLCHETSDIIGHDVSKAKHVELHRWLYANIDRQYNSAPYFLDSKLNLAACGDWCVQGRVEAAFTSGYSLAMKLRELLED
jgi:predicted NAD/FAD-dependent oxidoreductase